jgi:deoxyribodipyrimidine photo-lyase
MLMKKISIFWFRRDLRIEDNSGLFYALNGLESVYPIFIFDPHILGKLSSKKDARVHFIHEALLKLSVEIGLKTGGLQVYFDEPIHVFQLIAKQFQIMNIFSNHDYEKYAIERDAKIKSWALQNGVNFLQFKDQVIFEKDEVLSGQNTPYTVFTPYSRKWKEKLTNFPISQFNSQDFTNYFPQKSNIPSLQSLGFENSTQIFPDPSVSPDLIIQYAEYRDFPSLSATSKLSVHLRFGTVSIRGLVLKALGKSEVWLSELIWRDFYFNILYHFPHINEGKSFRKEYDLIEWRNNELEFEAWKTGNTGYPIVDAGMRELNTTGFMHNRVRMIVASFLVKHLLIDWKWGEAYFAEKLLDFDFSANNGGWQWASGSGCDAAPYFRVFNPYLQTERFDKQLHYIKKWVPEFQEFHYPKPIVNHEFARKRVLEVYKKALNRD